jgi:TolA-binding protein
MPTVACADVAAAIFLLPTSTFAQDRTYIEDRLDGLQRQLADLSARTEELKVQEQQLQEQLENMRRKSDAHLERLEKGGASRARTPR